jgi:DNA-binding transcriptional ArsR family regulator
MPTALATAHQTQSAPTTSTYVQPSSELAAAADSKGRVHAAWIEQGGQSAGSMNATLWYSTYDPEFSSSKSVRRLDSSGSLYSLSMTIDDLDNVHLVWVRSLANITGTLNDTGSGETKSSPFAIYYASTNSNGTLSTPSRLLESNAESIWTSITSGGKSQLYLAWTEVLRLNTTDFESRVYYAQFGERSTTTHMTGTLIATTEGSSRMLRATTTPDRNNLHLAWIQENRESVAKIVHSEVDLSKSVARIADIEDVDGAIKELALASTRDGEVVIGWVYQESPESGLLTRVMRFPRNENMTSTVVRIPVQDPEKLQSIGVDSQGNLDLVWTYVSEDMRAGPRPIAMKQQDFYCAEVGGDGKLSEKKEQVSYPLAVAAFVLGDDQLYLVSGAGVLEAARPVTTNNPNNPTLLVVALTAFVSVIGAMNTEPGAYLIASWIGIARQSNKRANRSGSADPSQKLVRKIRRHPGITLSDLKSGNRQNILRAAIEVRMLERSGLIRSVRDGQRQKFYSLALDDQCDSHVEELRRSILVLVGESPRISEAQIARSLGISQQLTNYHLRHLSDAKLLCRIRDRNSISYILKKRRKNG